MAPEVRALGNVGHEGRRRWGSSFNSCRSGFRSRFRSWLCWAAKASCSAPRGCSRERAVDRDRLARRLRPAVPRFGARVLADVERRAPVDHDDRSGGRVPPLLGLLVSIEGLADLSADRGAAGADQPARSIEAAARTVEGSAHAEDCAVVIIAIVLGLVLSVPIVRFVLRRATCRRKGHRWSPELDGHGWCCERCGAEL